MKLHVAFSRPKKFAIGSWAIRLATKSSYSHALLRWHSKSLNKDLIYQASHGMVHFTSGERFDANHEMLAVYEIQLTDEQHKAVMKKCIDLAGTEYGYWALIGMALERFSGIKNPFRDGDNTFVCSELVGEVLRQAKLVPLDIDLELAGPKELEQALILNNIKRV